MGGSFWLSCVHAHMNQSPGESEEAGEGPEASEAEQVLNSFEKEYQDLIYIIPSEFHPTSVRHGKHSYTTSLDMNNNQQTAVFNNNQHVCLYLITINMNKLQLLRNIINTLFEFRKTEYQSIIVPTSNNLSQFLPLRIVQKKAKVEVLLRQKAFKPKTDVMGQPIKASQ